MKHLSITLMALLLFSGILASAQSDVPWPPAVEAFFGQNVEIVSETLVELPALDAPTATPFPTSQCGNDTSYRWDVWVFYPSPLEATHLCEALTGELSEPLPEGYLWELYDRGSGVVMPSTSPDGRWVVLLGEGDRYDYPIVFIYDTVTESFMNLGEIRREPYLNFREWIENDIVLLDTINAGANQFYNHYVYVIDLRVPAVSKHGVEGANGITYHTDPLRLRSYSTGYFPRLHCVETWYEIETRRSVRRDYGEFCDPEYVTVDEDIAYYRIVAEDRSEAAVVRYNRVTGESAELYRGVVDQVAWVSEDERYAAFMLNTRNYVQVLPLMEYRSDDAMTSLTILDLTTGEALYEMPATWNGWTAFWSPRVSRYSGDWIYVVSTLGYGEHTPPDRLLRVNDSGAVEEIILDGRLSEPLGGGWAYLYQPAAFSEIQREIHLFSIDTQETVELVDTPNAYRAIVEHLHGNEFRVTIASADLIDRRRAIYVVKVEGVDI
jgi:hypothetical protein